MLPINKTTLRAVPSVLTPKAFDITDAIGLILAATLDKFEINTPARIWYFLGQIAKESDGFNTTVEYASGQAYEGRKDLGNTVPGYGRKYKGRGFIQLTGFYNFQKCGQALGIDFVNNPDKAAEYDVALTTACWFWKEHGINDACDDDDILRVTRAVNGGLNGLDDRKFFTARAKKAVQALVSATTVPLFGNQPVLHHGSDDPAVENLQKHLRWSFEPLLPITGVFDDATDLLVRSIQTGHGLAVDGIVGPKTWALILSAPFLAPK